VGTSLHQEIIERDYADRFPLFGDIMLAITAVPPMPAELEPFDRDITMQEARSEAQKVRRILSLPLHDQGRSMNVEIPLPCADPTLIESFFADVPLEEDFDDGPASIDYQAQSLATAIDNARAKQACAGCPMRLQCLTRSLKDEIKVVGREKIRLVYGVSGGWGPHDRAVIVNRLRELLRQPRKQ
jgi:hypothetical protein